MTGIESTDRLSPAQAWLLDNVRATSSKRADASTAVATLTDSQQDQLAAAISYLRRNDTRIVLNADLRKIHTGFTAPVIDGLLATHGLLNRFEIEQAQDKFPGPNMMSRIMEELILYGGTSEVASTLALLPATERPHYGTLDLTSDPLFGGTFLFEHVLEGPSPANKYQRFIEAQVLGGIDLVEDVECIYYPRADRFTDLARKIRRLEKECEIEAIPY